MVTSRYEARLRMSSCQRGVAWAVADAGGHPVLFVKRNRKALEADIKAALGEGRYPIGIPLPR